MIIVEHTEKERAREREREREKSVRPSKKKTVCERKTTASEIDERGDEEEKCAYRVYWFLNNESLKNNIETMNDIY
jgi:hypothetical protein